jgi:hypothetical protein
MRWPGKPAASSFLPRFASAPGSDHMQARPGFSLACVKLCSVGYRTAASRKV